MSKILELLQKHGITPNKVSSSKGGEYHSPCPGCSGEDRFHTWPAQNGGDGSFWCRGCDSGGDCLQFLMDFDGLTFAEAKRELGIEDAECGSSLDRRRAQAATKTTWQPESKDHPADVVDLAKWQEHAGNFVENCHAALLDSSSTLAWLAKRGITLAAVKKFKLGWHAGGKNLSPSFRPRESWGLTGGKNPKTGRPLMFVLPAGVVVPWMPGGIVRRIQVRLAKKDPKFPKKKYHAVVGSAMDTFISATNAPAYTTVETVLDAIMLDAQAGDLTGAVALISSHAKPTAEATTSMRQADVILGALDFDHAGSAASAWWPQNFNNYVRHPVPRGGDPGEAYEGGVDIRAWIKLGLPESRTIASIDDVLDFSLCEPSTEKPAAPVLPISEPIAAPPVNKDPAPLYHPEVLRLADLLKQCPVVIHCKTPNDWGVCAQVNFNYAKHWQLKGQIANLVFTCRPIASYLAQHPAKVINASNILSETK